MKIIGIGDQSAGKDVFIVEITRDQLRSLAGYAYGDKECPEFKVGTEIAIGKMYAALYARKHWESNIRSIKQHLESMIQGIDIPCPVQD